MDLGNLFELVVSHNRLAHEQNSEIITTRKQWSN